MSLLLSLFITGSAHAGALGSPVAFTDQGQYRLSIGFQGEGPPGVAPPLQAKQLRFDVIPVNNIGLFVDASWANALADRVGGLRDRTWTVGGGGRLAVFPTRTVGFGMVGRVTYGHGWTVAPYYLMADDSGQIVSPTTTATDPEVATTEETTSESTSDTLNPLFPAWAVGERSDETRRLNGRTVFAVILGERHEGWYVWAGPRLTVYGTQPVTGTDESKEWTFAFGPGRPVGGTLGFEANSDDIFAFGDPRRRWLSGGVEIHLFDVTGIATWIGYAW